MIEAEAPARRASLPTVPETEVRKEIISSAGECVLDQPKLTWAVDLGAEVRALSTFDLWYALSTGDISCRAKVWRVGREAWTSASEVPELACALAEVDEVETARHTLDYAVEPPSFGSEAMTEAIMRATETATDVGAEPLDPAQQALTPAPQRDSHAEVFEHELEEASETPETELTPGADLPSGQVISLHPVSMLATPAVTMSTRARRTWAAALAVAATLAVSVSFLAVFAGPHVPGPAAPQVAADAALLPTEAVELPALSTTADAGRDAVATLALEQTSSDQLIEHVRDAVSRARKSWSPSDKGQKRQRFGAKGPARKGDKRPAKAAAPVSQRSVANKSSVKGR